MYMHKCIIAAMPMRDIIPMSQFACYTKSLNYSALFVLPQSDILVSVK